MNKIAIILLAILKLVTSWTVNKMYSGEERKPPTKSPESGVAVTSGSPRVADIFGQGLSSSSPATATAAIWRTTEHRFGRTGQQTSCSFMELSNCAV